MNLLALEAANPNGLIIIPPMPAPTPPPPPPPPPPPAAEEMTKYAYYSIISHQLKSNEYFHMNLTLLIPKLLTECYTTEWSSTFSSGPTATSGSAHHTSPSRSHTGTGEHRIKTYRSELEWVQSLSHITNIIQLNFWRLYINKKKLYQTSFKMIKYVQIHKKT